jgi:hypothetical protein
MVAKCSELLRLLEAIQRTNFRHIITGNESWFYREYQYASQWSVSRDEVPQRVNAAIGTAQFVFTAIWGVKDFRLLDLMSLECRFHAEHLWGMAWRPWFRRSSHKKGLGMLLDSMLISTTAVFTSQK